MQSYQKEKSKLFVHFLYVDAFSNILSVSIFYTIVCCLHYRKDILELKTICFVKQSEKETIEIMKQDVPQSLFFFSSLDFIECCNEK